MKYLIGILLLFSFSEIFGQNLDSLIIKVEEDTSLFSGINYEYNLILEAYFPDCGEFGGHKEIITVKRIDDKLIGTVIIYSKICNKTDTLKILNTFQKDLNDDNIKHIYKYLNIQMNQSLQEEFFTHANSEYHSYFTLRDENTPMFKRLEIICRNSDKVRKGFDVLKLEMKK